MPVLPHCFRALGPHTASRIQSCSAYKRGTFDCASAGGSAVLTPTAPKPTSDRVPGPGKGKGVLHVFFSPSWEPNCLNSEPHQICSGGDGLSQLLAQGNREASAVFSVGVGQPLARGEHQPGNEADSGCLDLRLSLSALHGGVTSLSDPESFWVIAGVSAFTNFPGEHTAHASFEAG